MFKSLLCFQEKELKVQVLSSRELCSEFTPATGRHSIMEIKCRTELCTPCLNESKGSYTYVPVEGKRRISGFTQLMQVAGAHGLLRNTYLGVLVATCIEISPGKSPVLVLKLLSLYCKPMSYGGL